MARIKTQVFKRRMRALRGTKKNVMQKAFEFFKRITPIDTGWAKRNTKLVNNNIVANYPYAGVLDKGRHMTNRGMRGSKQAPEGMSKPTIERFQTWVRNFIKGI
jgi:hypothetical protein